MSYLPIHPICDVFPDMTPDEFASFVDSIAEIGQTNPIWTKDGFVIDGKHRQMACRKLGKEAIYQEYKGEVSVAKFVKAQNKDRRHLTTGQRAISGAKLAEMISAEIKEETRARMAGNDHARRDDDRPENNFREFTKVVPRHADAEAARIVGVSPKSVSDAKRIQEVSPEVAQDVHKGTKTLNAARRELGLDKPKITGKSRVNGELVDDPEDIAELRAAGKIPPNTIPEIEEPEYVTTLESVAEDIAEREAIQGEMSDEDWLATLPLSTMLSDSQVRQFHQDALDYREIRETLGAFKRKVGGIIKKRRQPGAYLYKARSFLSIKHPDEWNRCPEVQDGGCGGKGVLRTGTCQKCFGRGYWI